MRERLRIEDYLNKKYERLKIIGLVYRQCNKENRAFFICECECETVKEIIAKNVMNGRTKSCGCLNNERRKESHTKHGGTKTRIYSIWKNMNQRCYNVNDTDFKDYGARGISICDDWRNGFEPFRDWALENGYTDNLTLDRRKNDGNYEPSNCRFVNMTTQARNKRIQSNNTSGVNGVFLNHRNSKWKAHIKLNGKQIRLGEHDTIEQAAEARRQGEAKYWNK